MSFEDVLMLVSVAVVGVVGVGIGGVDVMDVVDVVDAVVMAVTDVVVGGILVDVGVEIMIVSATVIICIYIYKRVNLCVMCQMYVIRGLIRISHV